MIPKLTNMTATSISQALEKEQMLQNDLAKMQAAQSSMMTNKAWETGIFQSALGASIVNNAVPTDNFVVEPIENGYIIRHKYKTYHCADLVSVGNMVVSLLAASLMDRK